MERHQFCSDAIFHRQVGRAITRKFEPEGEALEAASRTRPFMPLLALVRQPRINCRIGAVGGVEPERTPYRSQNQNAGKRQIEPATIAGRSSGR